MSVRIRTIFDTTKLTAARDEDLPQLAAALRRRQRPHYFIDDEVALRLLCATYGGHFPRPRLGAAGLTTQDMRRFSWCALYPLPAQAFGGVVRKYGPGARNVIILGTAARPLTDGTKSLTVWQREEVTIYISEKVLLFPATRGEAAETPKDLTEIYAERGLLGVLEAAGNPPLDVLFFNPRQKDLVAYAGGRVLDRILAGTFAQ